MIKSAIIGAINGVVILIMCYILNVENSWKIVIICIVVILSDTLATIIVRDRKP